MAMRQSRRLRGLMPEEQILDQVCFIFQGSIDIGSLTRCVKTTCCNVFIHRRCHREMVTRVRKCGNCRRDHPENAVEIVMETDDEMSDGELSDGYVSDDPFAMPAGMPPGFHQFTLRQELNEYLEENRPLNSHYEGSPFWDDLPYNINSFTWHRYYYHLYDYVRRYPHIHAYVHGQVLLPVEPTAVHRTVIYRLCFYNTPFAFFNWVDSLRFRLVFTREEGREDITIRFLNVLPSVATEPLYPEDNHPIWI